MIRRTSGGETVENPPIKAGKRILQKYLHSEEGSKQIEEWISSGKHKASDRRFKLSYKTRVRKREAQARYVRTGKGKANATNYERKVRHQCLIQYGGNPPECACCGESILEFLCIDHLNGGGNTHRAELTSLGTHTCRWLKNNNFPSGFRVLCHNCNMAFGAYGFCPHNIPEDKLAQRLCEGIVRIRTQLV